MYLTHESILIASLSFALVIIYQFSVLKFSITSKDKNKLRFLGYIERIFLLFPIIYLYLNGFLNFEDIGFKVDIGNYSLIIGLILTITLFLFEYGLIYIKKIKIDISYKQYLIKSFYKISRTFITVALLEELFFRAIIQNLMINLLNNAFWGIILSAIIFGLFHLIYIFYPKMGYKAVLFTFIVGLIFGTYYYYFNNLWILIWTHLLIDAKPILLPYIIQKIKENGNPKD